MWPCRWLDRSLGHVALAAVWLAASSTPALAQTSDSPVPTPQPAAPERALTFGGDLTNYAIAESAASFGARSRAWTETSLRLNGAARRGRARVDVSALLVKTAGRDKFGTRGPGAQDGEMVGRGVAFYLDRANVRLEGIGGTSLRVTAGRQHITLGSQFLIGDGVYDGYAPSVAQGIYHNPRRGFDAVRAEWDARGLHYDAFVYRVHPTWDAGGGRDGWLGGGEISRATGGGSYGGGLFYRVSRSDLDNDMAIASFRGEQRLPVLKGGYVSGELAWELAGTCRNAFYCTTPGQEMNERAWHLEAGYRGDERPLKPFAEVGYVRYSADFTPLATGFSDWGKWYLGNQIDWIVFGTNSGIVRGQVGVWPHAAVKLRAQYHHTREAQAAPGARGSLSNEANAIAEWYPRERVWVHVVMGWSRPGAALVRAGLDNPFAGLYVDAARVAGRSSFDFVIATGVGF